MKDNAAVVTLTIGQLREIVSDAVREALSERDKAPALINLKTLAQKIGITERSILDLRKQGLPNTMIGDSPRFALSEVIEWLQLKDVREIAAALAKFTPLERADLSPDNVKEIGKRARVALSLLKPGQEVSLGGGVKISKATKKRNP